MTTQNFIASPWPSSSVARYLATDSLDEASDPVRASARGIDGDCTYSQGLALAMCHVCFTTEPDRDSPGSLLTLWGA
jgi:hypothetical protein